MRGIMYEEGFVPNPVVYVQEGRSSSVLDVNGEPFKIETKRKIGFDLTPKPKQHADRAFP
jgi:hypothetical protein